MLNKSIAYRLSVYISLAVVAVFVAFITIYILFNISIIKENLENKAVNISEDVKENIGSYVTSSIEVGKNIAEQAIFYDQHHSVEVFLKQVMEKYSFLNAIHVDLDSTVEVNYHYFFCFNGNDSIFFQKQNKPVHTCVTEQPYFQELIQNKKKDWSEPIQCERNNNVIVSYYTPVVVQDENKQHRIVGEVICELSLLELAKTIDNIKIGENGYAFLISKTGTYITHPEKDWILKRNVFDLPKKELNEDKTAISKLLKQPQTGSLIAHPERLNYEKCWVYYTPIKENGWILVLAIPYKELFEPLYLPILKMLFFSVLGILVIYILVTYISNKQIQPLSDLTTQLKRFSDISGESYAGEETLNEVKHVSESLNLLKIWYEKNKIKVSREQRLNKLKEDDIFMAAEIQQSLIKVAYPAFPNNSVVDLFALYKPARIVSGDLFDYFFRDEDHLVITMGDVSGKGVPAAFFMSVAQTVIKSVASDISLKNSSSIVRRVSEEMYSNNVHQFFLTLFLGILDIRTGKLTYCNAAHTTSYILKTDGSLEVLSATHGLPIGLYRNKGYRESRSQMEEGDVLILYTDGVSELQDENKLQYGQQRLTENLKSLKGYGPKEIVERIEKSLKQFLGEATQNDDICILVLKYKKQQKPT